MKKAIVFCVLMLVLGACETIKGAGRDIENAGDAIDRAL